MSTTIVPGFLIQVGSLCAFKFGASFVAAHPRIVIFIGGFTDGLLGFQYLPLLAEVLQWSNSTLIQPLLRSSYHQYGFRSIETDVEDIDFLIDELVLLWEQPQQLVLIGHSSGCQAIVAYLKKGRYASRIDRIVFQAPISQRDMIKADKDLTSLYHFAKKEVAAGRSHQFLPRQNPDSIPITAARCASLGEVMSEDDLFSQDLTDKQLQLLFAHIHIPSLWCFSLDDEFVLLSAIEYELLSQRLLSALPSLDRTQANQSVPSLDEMIGVEHFPNGHLLLRLNGNHQLSNSGDAQQMFVEAVAAFVGSV